MKARILLAAVIGACFAGVFYPASDWTTRSIVVAVSFFVLLGILFCTMLLGSHDAARAPEAHDPTPGTGQKKNEGV